MGFHEGGAGDGRDVGVVGYQQGLGGGAEEEGHAEARRAALVWGDLRDVVYRGGDRAGGEEGEGLAGEEEPVGGPQAALGVERLEGGGAEQPQGGVRGGRGEREQAHVGVGAGAVEDRRGG